MMNSRKCRKLGAMWAIGQGLLTALVPQLSVKMLKRIIGKNFENAEKLEAKPTYIRQLRAIGVGLAAAGIASLVMNRAGESEEESAE
jgi:Na+(H+)/acetate symporter ActP